jgi:hypothetical protein
MCVVLVLLVLLAAAGAAGAAAEAMLDNVVGAVQVGLPDGLQRGPCCAAADPLLHAWCHGSR